MVTFMRFRVESTKLRLKGVFRSAFTIILFVAAMVGILMSHAVEAKRAAPAEIKPVLQKGLIFSYERHFDHKDHYSVFLICRDIQNARYLWKTKIYEVTTNPDLESDVQDIFLKSLDLKNTLLIAIDENGQEYRVASENGASIQPNNPKPYSVRPMALNHP
jgi:hypothetical protein